MYRLDLYFLQYKHPKWGEYRAFLYTESEHAAYAAKDALLAEKQGDEIAFEARPDGYTPEYSGGSIRFLPGHIEWRDSELVIASPTDIIEKLAPQVS